MNAAALRKEMSMLSETALYWMERGDLLKAGKASRSAAEKGLALLAAGKKVTLLPREIKMLRAATSGAGVSKGWH